jgi:hypothetical protein
MIVKTRSESSSNICFKADNLKLTLRDLKITLQAGPEKCIITWITEEVNLEIMKINVNSK